MTFEEWWKNNSRVKAARENCLSLTLGGAKDIVREAWDAAQPKWQPIETAPKDTAIICCNELGNVGEACFISSVSNPAWYWADDRVPIPEALNPTKWMPLPAQPNPTVEVITMSNLIQHAKMELDVIGLTEDSPDEMNQMMRKHILTMVQVFADEGHSGFSASYALSILTKLLDFKPLTLLTGEDSEWVRIGDEDDGSPVYQNKRCSSVFKGAKGAYNIDGKVFWEWFKDKETGEYYKSYFTNSDSRVPVEFPYSIPKEPEYIFVGEDDEEPF